MKRIFSKIVYALALSVCFSGEMLASQPESFTWQGNSLFAMGEFDGVTLSGKGLLQLGPKANGIGAALSGPVLALAVDGKDIIYAATATPAKIWQIQKGQAPRVIFETDKPLITAIVAMDNGDIAVVVAPDSGVYFVKANGKTKPVFVPVSEVHLLLGAAAMGDNLYLVGGGETGRLLRLSQKSKKIEILASLEESHLRSVYVDSASQAIYFGSAAKGTIYRLDNNHVFAIYQASGEVTAIIKDKKGRLFAALVDDDSSLFRDLDVAANSEKVVPVTPANPPPDLREIKSSQVVRIEKNGEVKTLWQSTRDGVLAMALTLNEQYLLLGTSPLGVLLRLSVDGGGDVDILAGQKSHPEISTIVRNAKDQCYLGMSALGEIFAWDESLVAGQGNYLSPVFDMGYLAQFGSVLVNGQSQLSAGLEVLVRVGNTLIPDQTWSPFVARNSKGHFSGLPLARYNQVQLLLQKTKISIEQVRMTYLPSNRAPQIMSVRVLPVSNKLVLQKAESEAPKAVSLDQAAFASDGRATIYAPFVLQPPQAILSKEAGMRSLYAYAEDIDADALRYQFYLEHLAGKDTGSLVLLKPWSEDPSVTFDSYKMADGRYRVRVSVDDLLSNGPARVLEDEQWSDVFEIANSSPIFTKTEAKWSTKATRVAFMVQAKLPLVLVQCAVDGATWMPVDPVDGITDELVESYDWIIAQKPQFNSVSCRAFDENGNSSRTDIAVKN